MIICNTVFAFNVLCYVLTNCHYRIGSTRSHFVYYVLIQDLQWYFLFSIIAEHGEYCYVCFILISCMVNFLFEYL